MRRVLLPFFLFIPTALLAQEFELRLTDTEGVVDGQAVVTVEFTNEEEPQGWQIGVCHTDGAEIDAADVEAGLGLEEVCFTFHVTDTSADGWAVAALLNVLAAVMMPPGDYDLYEVKYEIVDSFDIELEFCDTQTIETNGVEYDAPTVIIHDGEEKEPDQSGASITVSDPEFLRGDADSDGAVDALLDAVFLLEWGYVSGEHPPCMDAADSDDNGVVKPILDAIYLLLWEFAGGEAPPSPGTIDCGVDPSPGDDACLIAPEGC